MTFQKEVRYTSQSISPPPRRHSKSKSPARDRRRSRSQDPVDSGNPGNNLYVTGLSTRVTTEDLEKYFNKEGKVTACEVVLDPRTKESRGFAFVTMETLYDADRCIKYLNRSVLEGRLITVEKAKRRCGRTPTPGRYQGPREKRGHDRRTSRSPSPYRPRERGRSRSREWRDRRRSPHETFHKQDMKNRLSVGNSVNHTQKKTV